MVSRLAGLWAAILTAAEVFHAEVDGVPPAAVAELLGYVAGWFRESVRGEAPQHSHVAAYRDLMNAAVAQASAMYSSPEAGEKAPPGGWIGRWEIVLGGIAHRAFVPAWLKEFLARLGYPTDATLRAWRDIGLLICDKGNLTK